MCFSKSDEVGTYHDKFLLLDESGNVIAKKEMAQHLHWILAERGIKPGETFWVCSTATKYKLKVTSETTLEEWREFHYNCAMALD